MTDKLRWVAGKIAEGRKLLIYGAGNQGRGVAHSLRQQGVEPDGLVDRNPELQGRVIAGLPVLPPAALAGAGATDTFLIIIASFFFEREIAADLESRGFVNGSSFLPYRELKRHDYVVEVSGACNLRCISCPRAGARPTGRAAPMMGVETFKRVVDKIRREDAFVGNLQLYQWGEPTLNRHLPDMIRYARGLGMQCTVSSNLNHAADFRSLMESRPECLRVSVSGTGDRYAVTHTGGSWEVFASHVETVAELRRALCPEMRVELYYHRYRHATAADQGRLAEMCRRHDFEFHPIPAYLISLDDVLSYCEGSPLPEAARRARALLEVDVDDGLARARAEAHQDCEALRVVMVNADLSVPVCMMFYDPAENVCAENFLEVSLETIAERRAGASLCARCRRHGVHRYCGVYARIGEEQRT
jgi:hypothetical protein